MVFVHIDAVITWGKRALTFEDLHILPLSDNSYRDDSLQPSHDTVKILAVIQRGPAADYLGGLFCT